MIKRIILAQHQGFCMGVRRAIDIAEETSRSVAVDVTILNEIVHNEAVVDRFRNQGVGQASSIESVDRGTLIISAHGIAPSVIDAARNKGLNVVDATCPLVVRIYDILKKAVREGYHIIHFGDPDHDETQGIVGHAPEHITVVSRVEQLEALPAWPDRKLGLTVQTTAHTSEFADAVKATQKKWPHIRVFDTICMATTKRQSAIFDLAPKVDMILVVGSRTSANSKRLAQISTDICGQGFLIGSAAEIREEWFESKTNVVGVSAGASTPQFLVDEVVEKLYELSARTAEIIAPEKRSKSRDRAQPTG